MPRDRCKKRSITTHPKREYPFTFVYDKEWGGFEVDEAFVNRYIVNQDCKKMGYDRD